MPLKFAANISTLFREVDFPERFKAARDNGFRAIEIQSPYDYEPEYLGVKKGDLKCTMINMCCDEDVYGCASSPCSSCEFFQDLGKTYRYYFTLQFEKIHLLAGTKNSSFTPEEFDSAYLENLKAASESLGEYNMIGLIEPICHEVIQDYYLSSFDKAIEVIEELKKNHVDNIKLLLDVYHLHKITGDVKENLEKFYPYAGHIQISQDPDRMEPFNPNGKIDYEFVLKYLEDQGYNDYIGLEYIPSGKTEESLSWITKYI